MKRIVVFDTLFAAILIAFAVSTHFETSYSLKLIYSVFPVLVGSFGIYFHVKDPVIATKAEVVKDSALTLARI